MARMGVHLQGARRARQEARQAGQARNALDAFGYASMTVRMVPGGKEDGRLVWQTPLARELLLRYYGTTSPQTPQPVLDWLRRHLLDAERQIEPPRLTVEQGPRRLSFRLHQLTEGSDSGGDWLIVMREISDDAVVEAISLSFKLTAREAEVLYWLVKGKVNRDIGDILGASPATVKKHLERVYSKMGVETRTAAAGRAMSRIRQLHPEFES
ncbi:MAG: two component transcriptional regulator, LuxR family [Polaromonas sp.]|nr:two component transcriptional regulator, LuxR family [Polaromonas sp.]